MTLALAPPLKKRPHLEGFAFDGDGRLHIKAAPISKACVSPYRGRELRSLWTLDLDLDPDRFYLMLRDPDELRRAARTFCNIPVRLDHNDPASVVGVIAEDAVFVPPFLYASLTLWSQDAIDMVLSGERRELSAGYYRRPDMTPGSYQGQLFDGVMRSIEAEHVALVPRGRCGPECAITTPLVDPLMQERKTQ
jgi:hypothetical protein